MFVAFSLGKPVFTPDQVRGGFFPENARGTRFRMRQQQKRSAIPVYTRICRLLGVVAVGLMLASCDKCNDWRIFGQSSGPQVCKGVGPQQH